LSGCRFAGKRIFIRKAEFAKINEALLKLKENGTYDQRYKKWFGGNGS